MESGGLKGILDPGIIYRYWKKGLLPEDQQSEMQHPSMLLPGEDPFALLWLECGVLSRELGEMWTFSYSWGGSSVALPLVLI